MKIEKLFMNTEKTFMNIPNHRKIISNIHNTFSNIMGIYRVYLKASWSDRGPCRVIKVFINAPLNK